MNDEKKVVINSIEVDTLKAQKMLAKLIMREKINIKTREYNDGRMVAMIKKLIEEEVKCY